MPVSAYDGQHYGRVLELSLDDGCLVLASLDGVHVLEHLKPAMLEVGAQAPGMPPGIIAPVAEKDPHTAVVAKHLHRRPLHPTGSCTHRPDQHCTCLCGSKHISAGRAATAQPARELTAGLRLWG